MVAPEPASHPVVATARTHGGEAMSSRIFCGECGLPLGENERPCPHCGCATRRYDERGHQQSVTLWVGARWTHSRPGFRFGRRRRAVAEGHVRYEGSQQAELARNEQLIERDRRRARWRFWERGRKFHRVTDAMTGRAIHQHDGPLQTWAWIGKVREGADRHLVRHLQRLLDAVRHRRRSGKP
jgi:hypothetical protein